MLTLNDGRDELWQWDTGRTLIVDPDCSQVHFRKNVFDRSIDVDVVNGVAIIPDVLLQTDKDLIVWAFSGTAENGYTKIRKTFKVNRRNKPADYVFTPPDQTSLEEIKERVSYLESMQDPGAIKNAVEDYLEQNPVEAPVQSVNGKTGAVKLNAIDVGAISQDNLQDATDKALAQAKASGEFDGAPGADGHTPEYGVDYGTPEQIAGISNQAAEILQPEVNQLKNDLTDLQTAKMERYTIKIVMDSVATPHTQYYLGNQTTVDIVLPDSADVGQIIMLCWYNGDTAATLSITGKMLSFDYTPSANTRSEINALWDGTYWAVLGNEMSLPSEVTA